MPKCKYFKAVNPKFKENCANCLHWNVDRCRYEHLLRDDYEDSDEFKYYDSMMRKNRGVVLRP